MECKFFLQSLFVFVLHGPHGSFAFCTIAHFYSSFSTTTSLQTLLGYFAFKDVITSGRLLGIVLILSGSALYTYAKDREMRATPKPTYIPMTQQDVDEDDKHSKSRD